MLSSAVLFIEEAENVNVCGTVTFSSPVFGEYAKSAPSRTSINEFDPSSTTTNNPTPSGLSIT